MVLKKCIKCKKNITKKAPGLECSRCNIVVHADPACAKLSNKQLNTLRNSPGIEWSCEECMKNVSRRSSFFLPNEDEDEDEEFASTGSPVRVQSLDTEKLIRDITREVKKTFREELAGLEASLEFVSDQISNMEKAIKNQDLKIEDLQNKNKDLQNRNKNLELKMCVLEQEVKQLEQKSLSTSVEIVGLPETAPKDIGQALVKVASKLDLNVDDILSSQRLPGSKDKPGPILVEMNNKASQVQWITAGKEKRPNLALLFPETPKDKADSRIYIREALTKSLKTLLYTAKTQLGMSHQFIWCKDGKVFVRKTGSSKIYQIRSTQDITQLQKDSAAA